MGLKNRADQNTSSRFKIAQNRTPIGGEPVVNREAQMRLIQRREAVLKKAIRTQTGLRKIAGNLANPVREKLDFQGITRKFAVVEMWPDGLDIYYDKDIKEWAAVTVGKGGASRMLEIMAERMRVKEYQTSSAPMVPYMELYIRLYQVLNRVRSRLEQAMMLKEDRIYYAALESASTSFHTPVNVASYLTKDALSKMFTPLEFKRLPVANVIFTAYANQSFRRWQHQDINESLRENLMKSGYMGGIWGASFWLTDQIPTNTVYVTSTPELHAWMPIRKDMEVVPNDEPRNLLLGFVAYQLNALTIHNVMSCSKATFSTSA